MVHAPEIDQKSTSTKQKLENRFSTDPKLTKNTNRPSTKIRHRKGLDWASKNTPDVTMLGPNGSSVAAKLKTSRAED